MLLFSSALPSYNLAASLHFTTLPVSERFSEPILELDTRCGRISVLPMIGRSGSAIGGVWALNLGWQKVLLTLAPA